MRFHCANGLLVLRICALLEAALVAKNAFCWQQCLFFTHVFLHIVYIRYGQTCSAEESFAENQNTSEPKDQFVVSIQIRKIHLDAQ